MSIHRRRAKLDAVLVYFDEPQVIALLSQKVRVLALAIPDDDQEVSKFFATTVHERDWAKYLAGIVDLRYLFTFPTVKLLYTFDLNTLDDNETVMMTPWGKEAPEKYLPAPRFFSSNHTTDFGGEDRASDKEVLFLDGEWELQDFGQFQQKYSDIYAFMFAAETWSAAGGPTLRLKRIQEAFLLRPFQGGFSYVHLFKDLNDNIPHSDQLALDKIKYASPGTVEILGKEAIFQALHNIVPNYLHNRDAISGLYKELYKFLSERRYMAMPGLEFSDDDPAQSYIRARSSSLCLAMLAPDYDAVLGLTRGNALVAAKVIMAFYRRLNDASTYFAQGRVGYTD